MQLTRALAVGIAALVLALPGATLAQSGAPAESAAAIATDVYIYGYPLVTMELTRRSFTNVPKATPAHAPMGQFANMTAYPAVDDHRVTAPNADTLYSTAWLDVSKEPVVLGIPDMHGRYYLMPMLDGYTNVFQVPGTRTTGTGAQKYLITGPGWHGSVPAGMTQYKAPTGLVWILGRIYCTGTPADYAAVHALQAKLSLVPLAAYGKAYTPPAQPVNPAYNATGGVRAQVEALSGAQYFALLGDLMRENPPEMPQDAAIVKEMTMLGLTPGQPWDVSKLSSAAQAAIAAAKGTALKRVTAFASQGLEDVNGWEILKKTGIYGDDYVDRAFVTAVGLGANRPQDAIYPLTPRTGTPDFEGSHVYVIHFAKGMTPPVKGFWSITMYDPSFFFVKNALNKQSISPRQNFARNPDGSIDLYFSHAQPSGVPASNWLPAPAGKFILMMRTYYPNPTPPSLLDGTWKPPAVTMKR
ncbi:MAG TPA: DUF1254 domain-containing protein [Candidatus Acidoferrales bacterium]|nr:DUF1254 domain-containing protein [Candidatus Acidoferrales bacterium]